MIPNEDSYCEIDPVKKDAWGIPVLRFHFKWSQHEEQQAAHMQRTFAEIISTMGGKVVGQPGWKCCTAECRGCARYSFEFCSTKNLAGIGRVLHQRFQTAKSR